MHAYTHFTQTHKICTASTKIKITKTGKNSRRQKLPDNKLSYFDRLNK